MKRVVLIVFGCLISLSIGFGVGVLQLRNDASLPIINESVLPEPKPLSAFTLTDYNNEVLDNVRLRDKWSFIFLGYTHCPDICPVTAAVLSGTQKALSEAGTDDDVQYFFVSVDPARDSLDRLKEYLGFFNHKLIGVTGEPRELEASKALGVAYVPANPEENGEDYTVSHSSSVVLVNPDARLHAVFSPPHRTEEMVEGFMNIVRHWESALG